MLIHPNYYRNMRQLVKLLINIQWPEKEEEKAAQQCLNPIEKGEIFCTATDARK